MDRFAYGKTTFVTDSVFGEMRFSLQHGACYAETFFPPLGKKVDIILNGAMGEINHKYYDAFTEITRLYPEIRPQIANALFSMYAGDGEQNVRGPKASSPEELMKLLQLDGIFIGEDDYVDILYGFREGWDDAMLTVRLQNGHVEPFSFDD